MGEWENGKTGEKDAYVNKALRMRSHNTLPTHYRKNSKKKKVFIQLLNSFHWSASALFTYIGSLKPEISTYTEAWSRTASLELRGTTAISRAEARIVHAMH